MPYNLDSINSRLVVVGAGDAALHYIGNWTEDDWENGPGDALWKSTTSSDSISFSFHGTRILLDVVSTPNITSSPPTIQWSIDDRPPLTANVQASSSEWSFQTLIDQPNLPDGTHTINVTIVQVSANYPFLLDSFAFAPSSKFWSEALSATPSTDPSMTGVIVGGIIGGVLLALVCMSCTVWLRRRRARRFLYSTLSETEDATMKISPFTLRVGQRLGRTLLAPSNTPHPPPSTTQVSIPEAEATMTSQDSNDIQDPRVSQVPKRKGYKLRTSQHLRSLRALVSCQEATGTGSTSSVPSTPPPHGTSEVLANPSGHGSEPPTPPPLYTA